MDIKKNLRTYMFNFSGSFVGFFNIVAEILFDLSDEWDEYSKRTTDTSAKEWATTFNDCGNSIIKVANKLTKIQEEYYNQENVKTPADVINNFKDKILKEIKK